MIRAIGYVRVSTQEQVKGGISLDMQRSKILAYTALEGMKLVDMIADEGISGCSIKIRPGIQSVLEKVRRGEVAAVIVYKLDRLARNTVEALEIAKILDKKGAGLHSISEKLDTHSPLGRFFFTLMASLAEMERALIAERIRAAMERKRERGESCSGNPPYGFQILEGMLIPDEQERVVIERIRCLRSEGRTIHQIVGILNDEGVRNRRGREFGQSQVHVLVQRCAA